MFVYLSSQGARHPVQPRPVRVPQEDEVLVRFAENPRTSSRLVAAQAGCSQSTVLRITKQNHLHPWKLQKVQHLKPDDLPIRAEYCRWVVTRDDPWNFLRSVLTTDEKGFSREGTFNLRNNHWWTEENPHQTFVRGYQQKFFVNVWAGILDDNFDRSLHPAGKTEWKKLLAVSQGGPA